MTYEEVKVKKVRPGREGGNELLQMTLSAAMGWCVGYSVKKLGKVSAFIIGADFLALQALVRSGYLKVNWAKISEDFSPTRDRVRSLFRAILALATYNFPFVMTFTAGFLVGFKYG
jgi:uncharacterized membrane protein (Fun14 family)